MIIATVANFQREVEQKLEAFRFALGADAATLHFYDEQANILFLPVGVGLRDKEQFERGIPNMSRVPGRIVRTRKPVFAEDIAQAPGLTGPFSYREGVRSGAGLPVVDSRNKLLAVAFVNYRQPKDFTAEEQRRVTDAVSHLAAQIETLLDSFDQEVIRPEVALNVAVEARQEMQLQLVVDRAHQALHDASVAIWMVEGDHFVIRVFAGIEATMVVGKSLAKDSRDIVARAYSTKDSVLVENVLEDPDFELKELGEQMGWNSALAVPMMSAYDQLLGVIVAYTIEDYGFAASQEALVTAFAGSAAAQLESERKISSLNALHDLGIRLTLALDRAQVLQDVVSFAPRITGADICSILLYDAAKQDFEDASTTVVYGADPKNVEKPRTSGSLTERVLRLGWVVCEDMEQERNFTAYSTFVRKEKIQAYIGISLEVAHEPFGVLYLSYRQPHRFTADELTLIRALGHYAATAIYIAQLFTQRETFADIAREITLARSRSELIRTVLDHALTLLGSDRGSIGLLDPESGEIRIDYAIKTSEQTVPSGKGLVSAAIQAKKPVRVDDVLQDERYLRTHEDTRSELDVPLLRGDEVIGVLNVESTRVAAFSEEHEKLAVALAAQAVVALDKLDLTEQLQAELQQRVSDIEILQEAYGALSPEALPESLQRVVKRAMELTGAKYGAVYLIDRSAQRPELYLVAQPDRVPAAQEREKRIPLDPRWGFIPYVGRTGELLCCDDVSQDSRFYSSYADVRSELTVPLKYSNRVYGVIDLESTVVNGFGEREQRLLEAIAGAAAGVVRQVKLYENLEAVNRLSQKLNSGVRQNEREVFELIYNEATQLMDTNNMYIALYDEYSDTVRFGLVYVKGERIDIESNKHYQPRRAGAGRTEWIIRNRQPLFHPTGTESVAWYSEEGHVEYTGGDSAMLGGSWVGVPMIADTAVLGVVATYHPTQDHVYSRDDLTSLQAMANQAGIAISNVRLNQQRKLREISQVLSANIYLTEKELLNIIYEQASDLMRTDEMYIALYDEATNVIRFELAYANDQPIDVEPRTATSPYGRTEWIIHHKEPLFHPTKAIGLHWYAQPGRAEFIGIALPSWVGVPMITDSGRVLGVIAVYSSVRDYVYFGHDLGLLQTLATAAANALENSRRYWEVQEASQGLGTLGTAMGAIQHRINNTLNIVSPNVKRLRRRVDHNDETIQEILDIIDRNVQYTSQIIHRIQEALRGERQVVNLNAILYDVAHQAQQYWNAQLDGDYISVKAEFDDNIPLFEGPIGQITELFTNLAHNACRAMKTGGELNLSSKLEGDMILVWVKDAGPGIPESVLLRLFKQPVSTSDTGGTSGLGLYLGSLIVRSLGGQLNVEDTGPDGTTMLVCIPIPHS